MQDGRIDMTEEEEATLDALVADEGAGAVSRRDPGDTGPLVLKLKDGRHFEIDGRSVTQVREERRG